MEIRQLKYLLSTARLGSVNEAAREHFVTQPAVSIQLKKLEQEFGEKLVVRRGRRIVPTQVGDYILRYAEEILQRVDSLEKAVLGLKGCETGSLRLGTIDSASIYVLPRVFRSFRRKHPGVEIRVTVSDTRTLLDSINAGRIELAIATLPIAGVDLDVLPIYRDQMVLVANPRHPLAGLRAPTITAVAETGLIMYPAQSTTRRLIERVFVENGVSPRATMEISSPEAMKRLAETGLGASILPLQIVSAEVRRGTLKIIPTGKVRFFRILGAVYKGEETLSPPGRVFLDMLREKFRAPITPEG